ncbi:hypothetical protein Peur_053644 [Populus x canadensis]
MDSLKLSSGLIFIQLVLLAFVFNSANAQLKVGFYKDTCPQAEAIVKGVMDQVLKVAPSLSGPLLSTGQAEKDSPPNLSLRGYQVIDRVKAALEKKCPGVVSCADILAIVARDVTVATLGPSWRVETGRRDGRVSNFSEPLTNLPPFFANISQLLTQFRSKNLSKKDLVVLSGAHTIGTSHCSSFDSRLYNFTGKGDTDPTLDSEYITRLKKICKAGDQITLVEMDPGGARTFDNSYYKLVANRRALFQSDAALLDNNYTKAYVKLQSVASGGSTFFKDFGVSMRKMGRVEVLTAPTTDNPHNPEKKKKIKRAVWIQN